MNKFCHAVLLALFLAQPAFAQDLLGKITEDKTYLRTDPNVESSVLLEVPKDATVTVVEEKDGWKLVRTEDNRVGWVRANQVALAKSAPTTIAQGAPKENAATQPAVTLEPTITDAIPPQEAFELSLVIRPGYDMATKHPAGMDNRGFSIGAHVAYFLTPRVGLSIPYTFRHFDSSTEIHTVGLGPVVRYLELERFRGTVDANGLYARAFGRNEWAWSAGWDFTFGFKTRMMRPFFGPFVRYEQIIVDGPNLNTWSFGLGLSLTNFTHF